MIRLAGLDVRASDEPFVPRYVVMRSGRGICYQKSAQYGSGS
jgi:hypothetical protein